MGALILAAAGITSGSAASAAALGPGCAPSRPAVAHRANAQALSLQPKDAPVPCGVTDGYPAEETRIAVTKTGAVFYAPALVPLSGVGCPHVTLSPVLNCAGLARTKDLGHSWTALLPPGIEGPNSRQHATNDHNLYADKDTGRLFWSDPTAEDTEMMWSQDDGKTWTHSLVCCSAQENPEFVTAKPRISQPHGYPKVVYFCANFGVLFPPGRVCQKSLDGGTTWVLAGQGLLESSPAPTHSECASTAESFGPGPEGYPVPLSDGSLVAVLSCGTTNLLVRSTDEAASWPTLRVVHPFAQPAASAASSLGAGAVLRSDADNNLYLMNYNAANTGLLLTVSRDLGKSWTPPINVVAPGLTALDPLMIRFSVAEPGHLAVSYLGQRKGSTGYDGYLTETWDALRTNGVFYSGLLNDPRRPLMYGPKPAAPYLFGDFLGVDIGPDGTAWASFIQDCGPSLTSPSCTPNVPGETTDATLGFAGRLVGRPAGTPARSAPDTPSHGRGSAVQPPSLGSLPTTGLAPGLAGVGLILCFLGLSAVSRHRDVSHERPGRQ